MAPEQLRVEPPASHRPPVTASLNRRRFLQSTAATAGLLSIPAWIPSSARGAEGSVPPSQRINVGLIGVGAMGRGHLRRLAGDPGFQLLAVCDPDRVRREAAQSTTEQMYAANTTSGAYHGCRAYNDYREILARPDIDAVVIASPDHWHSLQSIDAAKAGKDVYCEKPISVTIEEGRRVVEAVRRYGRIFQTGTQYRSSPTIRQVCRFVRGGGLGTVKHVFTQLHTLAGWIGGARCQPYRDILNPEVLGASYVPVDFALPAEPVPEGLDWDLWVGPAPWRPYNRLYHENPSPGVVPWAFAEAFGVTSSTWFLSHAADVIQYALGVETSGPVELFHPRSGTFPTLTFRYATGTLLHFVNDWHQVPRLYPGILPPDARLAGMFGGIFAGERGWVTALSTGGPIEAGPASLFDEMKLTSREVNIGANDHHANWLKCVRSREQTYCSEELGHRTSSLGILTNIAYWTGQSLRWDPERETFLDCAAANRLRSRTPRAPWRI
ncbi:MAG: Gfo/Idh/MocA family oxidoreductase [Verrucomicrobiales bacterium]|nr:Gfo/Idh/MocA family oxidoreductase [Verrucomicrobiales bacterium]